MVTSHKSAGSVVTCRVSHFFGPPPKVQKRYQIFHTPNLGVSCFFALLHQHTHNTRYLMSQTKRRTPATNPHRQNARHNQNCALKTKRSFAKGQVSHTAHDDDDDPTRPAARRQPQSSCSSGRNASHRATAVAPCAVVALVVWRVRSRCRRSAQRTMKLSASNTVKKAALHIVHAQTRRLLRILGGDVSQKDQSKCHS